MACQCAVTLPATVLRVPYRLLYRMCADGFPFPYQRLARLFSCGGSFLSSHQFSLVLAGKQRPSGAHFCGKASTRPDVHRRAVLRRTSEHLGGTVPAATHVLGPPDQSSERKMLAHWGPLAALLMDIEISYCKRPGPTINLQER